MKMNGAFPIRGAPFFMEKDRPDMLRQSCGSDCGVKAISWQPLFCGYYFFSL